MGHIIIKKKYYMSRSNLFNGKQYQITSSGGGITYSDSYLDLDLEFDFSNKSIDIEKIKKYDELTSKLLEDCLMKFLSSNDHSIKRLLFNTLESYGIFKDKKSVERKAKINSSTNG
jgi:hypothetical protein